MESKDLANKIFEIVSLLKENEGLAIFASQKTGFEKWLQVELSGILSHYGETIPEENHKVSSGYKRIDIVFDGKWAMSLKDIKKKGDEVLYNLKELKKAPYNKYKKTCLVFLTFSPNGKKIKYDENIANVLENYNRIY